MLLSVTLLMYVRYHLGSLIDQLHTISSKLSNYIVKTCIKNASYTANTCICYKLRFIGIIKQLLDVLQLLYLIFNSCSCIFYFIIIHVCSAVACMKFTNILHKITFSVNNYICFAIVCVCLLVYK